MPPIQYNPRFQILTVSIPRCSFKLHATSRQLHEWTRSEKMKLKEQAVSEMAKEKQGAVGAQVDPCSEEKGLSAETEVDETFEGEMDDFQTPLVRHSSAPVLFYVTDCPFIAQQSRSLGTSLHSSIPLALPLFFSYFFSLDRICRTSFKSRSGARAGRGLPFLLPSRIIAHRVFDQTRPALSHPGV
jgi:hypothetical protein